MKIVGDKMETQMEEILFGLQIFLSAVRAELSLNFGATIEAIRLFPVFFVAHEEEGLEADKNSKRISNIEHRISNKEGKGRIQTSAIDPQIKKKRRSHVFKF